MDEEVIQSVDMTRVVVMECTESTTSRPLWAWCKVKAEGDGFEEVNLTTPNGLIAVDVDPGTVKFRGTLFVL